MKSLIRIACLVIIAMAAGSSLGAQPAPEELSPVLDARLFATYYKPIGPWTGQIILPEPARRAADGSVPFLVYTSPRPELVGRILRLAWDAADPTENWFFQARPDVVMDPAKVAKAEKYQCKVPKALDGRRQVGALESLPAGRAEGTIEVVLQNPVYADGHLKINREPAQVNGAWVCLARFVGPAEGNRRRIVHWNPATRQFDGPQESVVIMSPLPRTAGTPPQTSTDGLETSWLNRAGWYLYGKRLRDGFLVKSLEPRLPLLLQTTVVRPRPDEAKAYYFREHFENLRPGQVDTIVCGPAAGDGEKAWPVGTRALLIHLFGWRKEDGARAGPMDLLGLVTGHFAFGLATVIQDPFTGEKRFDIEYKQVYGHNREEVVSGTMKWHAYMGNLRRGWMYAIPVSDTLIQIPELAPFTIDGLRLDPLRGLMRELERMCALYRTGGGTGVSMVRPDVSCVQDSHCALYSGLRRLADRVAKDPRVAAWKAARGPADPEVARFARLESLEKLVLRSITQSNLPQGQWRDFADNPLGTRDPENSRPLVDAFLAVKTVFPRAAHDHLIKLAVDRGYRMWTILTVQVGGKMPGLTPQAPTSFLHR